MNGNGTKNVDEANFLLQLHYRAQQKAKEYAELVHERQRIEMRIERTKAYVEQLNAFLKAEGQEPVLIRESTSTGPVGKPGNRSKDLPVRKAQWEGLSINNIIQHILSNSPTTVYHPKDIAPMIYEIQSPPDLSRVMKLLRSAMQRGVKEGLWVRAQVKAKYKAKTTVEQGRLVNAS